MKKRLISAVAVIVAVSLIFGSQVFGGEGEAQYNDKTYTEYNNLNGNSTVPSLFKNDDVFSNYKDYPPVIADGVEYVPLELFYGLSDVKINYSDDNSNFYIQNKQTNEYISFSVSDNYAVTGKNKIYETEVPSFYGVQYVPLRAVCDTVSIGCSTYNDGENKVYAIEIYTGDESLSAQELLKIHAPELYEAPAEDSNGAGDNIPNYSQTDLSGIHSYPGYTPQYSDTDTQNGNTTSSGNTENQETKSEEKDEPAAPKAPQYKSGTVMFFYTPENFVAADKTLDALDELGLTAVFFVTEQNILENPDIIRRIYTSGHTIGITFLDTSEELFAENVLEEKVTSAENALYEVAKIKTRLLYLGETDEKTQLSADIKLRVENMGLCAVRLNGDAGTDTLTSKKAADGIKSDLLDIHRTYGSDTAYLRMHHTDSAISVLGTVAVISMTNPVIKIDAFDETSIQKN